MESLPSSPASLGAALHAARLARLASRGGAPRTLVLSPSLTLSLVEQPGLDIGSISWAGGEALARYLLSQASLVDKLRVLELGAGVGVVGLAARAAGAASVLITDHKQSLVDLALANVALNTHVGGNIDVATLAWGADAAPPGDPADVLLGADVVYTDESAVLFAATLNTLTTPTGRAHTALIAYKERGAGAAFSAALASANLVSTQLAVDGEHAILDVRRRATVAAAPPPAAPALRAPSRLPCALPR